MEARITRTGGVGATAITTETKGCTRTLKDLGVGRVGVEEEAVRVAGSNQEPHQDPTPGASGTLRDLRDHQDQDQTEVDHLTECRRRSSTAHRRHPLLPEIKLQIHGAGVRARDLFRPRLPHQGAQEVPFLLSEVPTGAAAVRLVGRRRRLLLVAQLLDLTCPT